MNSPLGENRGGTPRGVLLPQEQRRTARCGGWTLRLSAFRFLFLAFVIARSESDEAIQKRCMPNWIASLTLAMTKDFLSVRCADRDETGPHRRKSLTTIMREFFC